MRTLTVWVDIYTYSTGGILPIQRPTPPTVPRPSRPVPTRVSWVIRGSASSVQHRQVEAGQELTRTPSIKRRFIATFTIEVTRSPT
jgi:hypothetical protein